MGDPNKRCTTNTPTFNIFINDIFYAVKDGCLYNFANHNTIFVDAKDGVELTVKVKSNVKDCIKWFYDNRMSAYPSKFKQLR